MDAACHFHLTLMTKILNKFAIFFVQESKPVYAITLRFIGAAEIYVWRLDPSFIYKNFLKMVAVSFHIASKVESLSLSIIPG